MSYDNYHSSCLCAPGTITLAAVYVRVESDVPTTHFPEAVTLALYPREDMSGDSPEVARDGTSHLREHETSIWMIAQ